MKNLLLIPAVVIATMAATYAASSAPPSVATWLVPAVAGMSVVCAGLTGNLLRIRRERLLPSAVDSVERAIAAKAQSGAFGDALILMGLAVLAAVVFPSIPAIVFVLGMFFAALVDYLIRYSVSLRDLVDTR